MCQELSQISFIKILSPASGTERSAMMTFVHEKIPYLDLQTRLNTFKLHTRGVGEAGGNGLRISCHIYNTFEEIDRLLEGLRTA